MVFAWYIRTYSCKFGLMFFWYSSRASLCKSFLIYTFCIASFSAFGQENQGDTPIFSIPNKPILGIMTNENSIKGPEIQDNVIIEDALQTVSKSGANGAIVIKDGKKIGTVSLTDMIMAIARSTKNTDSDTVYR